MINTSDIVVVTSCWRNYNPNVDLQISPQAFTPTEGDLILCKVSKIGSIDKLDSSLEGEEVDLQLDDVIILVIANRYSGTSEYGIVPVEEIKPGFNFSILAHGGICGTNAYVPAYKKNIPTQVEYIGYINDGNGKPLNLRQTNTKYVSSNQSTHSKLHIGVLGGGAEIGKTTTAAEIISTLSTQNNVVGVKVTGTGRKKDIDTLKNSGAVECYDYVDFGIATTYTDPSTFTRAINRLYGYIETTDAHTIVSEFGGDIIEGNVMTFLQESDYKRLDYIVYVGDDVLGTIEAIKIINAAIPSAKLIVKPSWRRNEHTFMKRFRELTKDINFSVQEYDKHIFLYITD